MNKCEYENNYISFKCIDEDDTDLVLSWRNSDFVRDNFIYKEKITKEEHLNWISMKVFKGLVVQFVVYDKRLNIPFASVYFKNIDMISQSAEYGVFIGDINYVGKGWGQKIAKLMIKYGFEEMNLNTIMLRVFEDNIQAVKCYTKVGFTPVLDEKTYEADGRKVIFMEIRK